MKRSSTFVSIGVIAALIAAGIWFFYHWGYGPWTDGSGWWPMHQGWHGPGAMIGYGGPGSMMGFGYSGGTGLFGLMFWGLIILAVVLLISAGLSWSHRPAGSTAGSSYDPLEILKLRYARGEIDKEQFKAIRHDLEA